MRVEGSLTQKALVPKFVAYVFHTNGHYEDDPLGVRQTLQNLLERYGYYAKIELMTLGSETADDSQMASQTMADFLTAAKPQIELCLPDWNSWARSRP